MKRFHFRPLSHRSADELPPDHGPFCSKQTMLVEARNEIAWEEETSPTARQFDWTKRNISPAVKELIEIRLKLGMTQADFALALNESRDRLINLENGRMKKLPPQMLETARGLLEGDYDRRVHPLVRLKSTPMAQTVERWWKEMGVEKDEDGALILGVTGHTIMRWRTCESTPPDSDLLRYDKLVELYGAKLRSLESSPRIDPDPCAAPDTPEDPAGAIEATGGGRARRAKRG